MKFEHLFLCIVSFTLFIPGIFSVNVQIASQPIYRKVRQQRTAKVSFSSWLCQFRLISIWKFSHKPCYTKNMLRQTLAWTMAKRPARCFWTIGRTTVSGILDICTIRDLYILWISTTCRVYLTPPAQRVWSESYPGSLRSIPAKNIKDEINLTHLKPVTEFNIVHKTDQFGSVSRWLPQ